MKKCYSYNEEEFYDDIDSVIDYVDCNNESGEIVTICEADSVSVKASDFFGIDHIIETAQENACDDCGEAADGWLHTAVNYKHSSIERIDKARKLQKSLSEHIDMWADKHGLQPTFFRIENVKQIKIKYLGNGEYKEIKE